MGRLSQILYLRVEKKILPKCKHHRIKEAVVFFFSIAFFEDVDNLEFFTKHISNAILPPLTHAHTRAGVGGILQDVRRQNVQKEEKSKDRAILLKNKTKLEVRTYEFCFFLPFLFVSQRVRLHNPAEITSREHGVSLILLGRNSFITVLKDILIPVPRALYVGKVFASFEKMKT